jgi:hypothetical protein
MTTPHKKRLVLHCWMTDAIVIEALERTSTGAKVESSWNVMAHGDAREGKWRGNWRMEWVASTLHTTSERGVSSITTADAHTSADSSRLNWRPRRFKWPRPFRRKTKSGFCACAITFQMQSNTVHKIQYLPFLRLRSFYQAIITCSIKQRRSKSPLRRCWPII